MLWQQRGYRENMFVGRVAYGWFRPAPLLIRRLGQG